MFNRAHLVYWVLFVASVAWIGFRVGTGVQLEDALITWRFAENLARGDGFVFNPGERVLGTTTPLLTLLLVPAAMVAGASAIPATGTALMICAGIGAGYFAFRSLRLCGFSEGVSAIAAGAALLHHDVVRSGVGGMETPAVLLCMMSSLFCVLTQRPRAALLVAAALVLTRPDGAIWSLLIGLQLLREVGMSKALRAALPAALLLAGWVVFALWYFGSPLPHSLIAKSIIGQDAGPLTDRVFAWVAWIKAGFGVTPAGGLPAEFAFGIWSLCLLLGAGAILSGRPASRAWTLVAFPGLLALAYLFGRAPHFDWYLVPITWCAMLVGALGLLRIVQLLWAAAASTPGPGRWLFALAAAAPAFVMTAELANSFRKDARHEYQHQVNENQTRRALGEWIAQHAPANACVAMEAIGYQGSHARRRVIDLAGLISPEVVGIRRSSANNAEAFARILAELSPDYVVLRTLEVEHNKHFHGGVLFETAESRTSFERRYRPVRTFEAPYPEIWGRNSSITVFERSSLLRRRAAAPHSLRGTNAVRVFHRWFSG